MNGVDFGWLQPDSCGAARTVTITNIGSEPILIRQASLVGPHAEDFVILWEDFSNVELQPGARCSVEVQFLPGGPGMRQAELELIAERGQYRIPLWGMGAYTETQRSDGEPVRVEQKLQVAVPVTIDAAGETGGVQVDYGRRWVINRYEEGHGETVLFQELNLTVPVSLEVSGECGTDRLQPVACSFMCTQAICVELPIRVGAAATCTQGAAQPILDTPQRPQVSFSTLSTCS